MSCILNFRVFTGKIFLLLRKFSSEQNDGVYDNKSKESEALQLTEYNVVSDFIGYLGLPDDHLKVLLNFKPSHTLKKEGDQYILSMSTPGGGNKDLKFNDGVEFDEEATPGKFAKTKFIVEGNVITQIQTFPDGLCLTYIREFSGDDLAIVIKSNKWDNTACRYYKAA